MQKLHLITGKGGVGKSAVAAAFAFEAAQKGQKTLLVELGERGFYSNVWGRDFGFRPTPVEANLWISRWSGEDCLREYFGHLIRIQKIVDLIFDNKIMKALVRAAPALNELAILGKFTSGYRKVGPAFDYDCVVLDAYSTGHFKALLNAPRGMSEAVSFGPMGDQSRSIEQVMTDPEKTRITIVTLPEELPVTETLELAKFLRDQFRQTPDVILNKVLDVTVDDSALEKILNVTSGSDHVLAQYVLSRKQQDQQFRQELESAQMRLKRLPHFWEPTSVSLYKKLQQALSQ